MRNPKAFTLVELLVVIGIIALLISMLLPALNKARNASKEIVCASNLRQLGMGVQQYATEFRNNVPFSDAPSHGWVSGYLRYPGVDGAVYKYLSAGKLTSWGGPATPLSVAQCPFDLTPTFANVGSSYSSYGVNAGQAATGANAVPASHPDPRPIAINLNRIVTRKGHVSPNNAGVVYLLDAHSRRWEPTSTIAPFVTKRYLTQHYNDGVGTWDCHHPQTFKKYNALRTKKGVGDPNALFFDFHVEKVPQKVNTEVENTYYWWTIKW